MEGRERGGERREVWRGESVEERGESVEEVG